MSFWSSFEHSPVNNFHGLASESYDLRFVVLQIAAACCMAKGHSSAVIVLSHYEIAWFSIDRAAAPSVPFDLSPSPFYHCVFTPLKLSRWFCF
jgi:hypothetical protein